MTSQWRYNFFRHLRDFNKPGAKLLRNSLVINKKAWRRSAIKDCYHRVFGLRPSPTVPKGRRISYK